MVINPKKLSWTHTDKDTTNVDLQGKVSFELGVKRGNGTIEPLMSIPGILTEVAGEFEAPLVDTELPRGENLFLFLRAVNMKENEEPSISVWSNGVEVIFGSDEVEAPRNFTAA